MDVIDPQLNNPPSKNWFSKHMILGYLFLGLFFAGIVAGVYWFEYRNRENRSDKINMSDKSQVTDTSDWKTYKSEEYSFEFKHPPNYLVKEQTLDLGTSGKPKAFILQLITDGMDFYANLRINVNNPYSGLPEPSSTDERININGISMIKSTETLKFGLDLRMIYYSFNQNLSSYEIIFSVPLLDEQNYEAKFNSILSTFMFIE